jgi:hypothetical protein
MKHRLASACALVVALLARGALAQEAADVPMASPSKGTSRVACDHAFRLRGIRAADVVTYFKAFDLPVWGAGVAASLQLGKCKGWETFAELRFLQEVTPQVLLLQEPAVRVFAEWMLGRTGLRLGGGGGPMYLLVHRATTGSLIAVPGLDGFVRLGYDAGVSNLPFVFVDLEVRAPLGAILWGPTLQAGWRF